MQACILPRVRSPVDQWRWRGGFWPIKNGEAIRISQSYDPAAVATAPVTVAAVVTQAQEAFSGGEMRFELFQSLATHGRGPAIGAVYR